MLNLIFNRHYASLIPSIHLIQSDVLHDVHRMNWQVVPVGKQEGLWLLHGKLQLALYMGAYLAHVIKVSHFQTHPENGKYQYTYTEQCISY